MTWNPTSVCDTLAARWDVLPELDCSCRFGNSDPCGRAIIPSSSGGDDRPAFRVLMIGADKYKSQFNLHRFTSSERSWSAPAKCFNMMEHQIWFMEEENAVVCRGNAHWLCVSNSHCFHVLNVDVETGHVSLTKLVCPFVPPTMADHMRLNRLSTTVDGTLLSLCVYRGRQLEVWTQQDNKDRSRDGNAEWLRTRVIDQKLTEVIQQSGCPSCIWSGERSGTLLITDYASGGMYIAHLDTATLEEVTDRFRDCNVIVPMEIDWPTFFMTRLGGL